MILIEYVFCYSFHQIQTQNTKQKKINLNGNSVLGGEK